MPLTNDEESEKQMARSQTEAEQSRCLNERNKDVDALVAEKAESFSQLPISSKTLEALDKAGFVQLTDIQRDAVPRALCGRDVLGAAKTGTGKTLAFIIPILERLYRVDWSSDDGLGALVISPTRELALQIFQVLRSVGAQHSFSAGLIIGGKDVKIEKDRVHRMNILICTPSRLLQHMDETPGFDCSNLQILVLDEADRILDMGFARTVNAIVENLPRSRQTLLFSATQTKSVKDLARLSLKDPDYVAVHKKADSATPSQLMQTYVVCELSEKLDLLWSFVRTHTQHKTVVFVSSCKQVRFIYETFRRMRAGITMLQLYGKQKQHARMTAYDSFTKAKSAIMFATDIAARGLDFPAVDWVVQLDCPEDIDTYIHRVGRTARYQRGGSALMFLCPSEEAGMLQVLEKKKVPIKKIQINPSKTVKVRGQLQALCSQFPEPKYLGQKAFVSYVRSIHLQANKAVFDVNALPLDDFAESLGLPGSPKIKFIQKSQAKNDRRGPQLSDAAAAASLQELGMSDEEDSESEEEVKTDIHNIVLPGCTLNAVVHAYYGVATINTVLLSVAKTFLWGYLGLLCCDIANQLMGMEEDRINKPFRPLITGQISVPGAIRLLVVSQVLFVAVAYKLGVLWSALSLTAAYCLYNFTSVDRHWVGKNACNGWGYGCYFSAGAWIAFYDIAAASAPALPPAGIQSFICALVVVNVLNIFFSITIQDLRDVDGDLKSKRVTQNLAWGELPARVYLVAMMAFWTWVQATDTWLLVGPTVARVAGLDATAPTSAAHSVSYLTWAYYFVQFVLVAWVGLRVIRDSPSYRIVQQPDGGQVSLLSDPVYCPLLQRYAKQTAVDGSLTDNGVSGLVSKLDDATCYALQQHMLQAKREQYERDDMSYRIYILWLSLYTIGPLF
ncbi:ATP-dependent RNA helicase dbp4 [Sorochytrium milnesiophthora]